MVWDFGRFANMARVKVEDVWRGACSRVRDLGDGEARAFREAPLSRAAWGDGGKEPRAEIAEIAGEKNL